MGNFIVYATKTVLGERKYRKRFLLLLLLVLVVSSLLMTFISLPGLLLGELLFSDTITVRNFLFFVVFSFLMSLSIAMHMYKFAETKKFSAGKENIAFFGGFLGLFTSGCSICYPLILTTLGIPTALSLLPFGGIELQALSIILLLVSIYFVSKSIARSGLCAPRIASNKL